ncbi:MAG: hypothetical protein ABEJ94_05205 [Halorientalis sp.]
MKRHVLLALVFATVLVGPVTAATGTATAAGVATTDGVDALAQTTNGTENGSTGGDSALTGGNSTSGNTTDGNTTAGSGTGDSGGDSSFLGIDLQSVAQKAVKGAILSLLDGLGDDATKVARDFADKGIIFSVPAPGEAANPPTWIDPGAWTGKFADWWHKTYTYYWVFGFLGFAGLLPALMFALGKGQRTPDRGTAKRFVRGFLLILLGWIAVAFLYHSADAVTELIAPPASEYMPILEATKSSNLKVLSPLLSGTKGTLLMTAFGVLYMQFILAFVCAALWPAMWVLYAYRSTMARTAGKVGLVFTGALLIMKIMQAVIFRFLVGLNLGAGTTAEIAATAGLTVAFVLLPYTVLTKMIPRTLLVFGLHEIRSEGHDQRRYQERMGNIRRKFNKSLRRSPEGGVERVGPASRGSQGLPDGQPRRLDSARSDGGPGLPRGGNGSEEPARDDAEDGR